MLVSVLGWVKWKRLRAKQPTRASPAGDESEASVQVEIGNGGPAPCAEEATATTATTEMMSNTSARYKHRLSSPGRAGLPLKTTQKKPKQSRKFNRLEQEEGAAYNY